MAKNKPQKLLQDQLAFAIFRFKQYPKIIFKSENKMSIDNEAFGDEDLIDVSDVKFTGEQYADQLTDAVDRFNEELGDLANSVNEIGSHEWNLEAAELYKNLKVYAEEQAQEYAEDSHVVVTRSLSTFPSIRR